MPDSIKQRDAALIRDFTPLALADYEYLRYSNERGIMDAFIAGDLEEPGLVYKDIELVHLDEHLEDLAALETVVKAYGDEVVRRAYLPKLKETRTKYELLHAALEGNDKGVHDASVQMYGTPREDVFHYSQRMFAERMKVVDDVFGIDATVRHALDTLAPCVAGIPNMTYPFESITLPPIKKYSDEVSLPALQIRAQCEAAFASYDIEQWQAVVDAPGERITFNANQELRMVFIPSDEDIALRKYPLTRERVAAIIAHEVGTHVVRRERGAASPLALLGIGLAGYLRGEEGIATYAEQILDGARHFAGPLGYLATGWAVGLDGTPRSFRALYEVLVAYFIVSIVEHTMSYGGDVDINTVKEKAKRKAWARCVRTFRGTSGSTPGACFTKDIVYREGNIAIWELVTKDPSVVNTFSLGKFDPANGEHVGLLRDLGMVG
jgi:hypothetical protein